MVSPHPRANIDVSTEFLARKDRRFAAIIERCEKPTLSHTTNTFRSLATSIIYQQLSGKAAAKIEERFRRLYMRKSFPSPQDVIKTPIPKFRSVGLSAQKTSYLIDLSEKFLDGTIQPALFHEMSDEDISRHVIAVKGIGQWTVDMFLLLALNRANVLPLGDLGIKKGFKEFFALSRLPSERTMKKLAKPFDGHWTVFSLYLWIVADNNNKRIEKK